MFEKQEISDHEVVRLRELDEGQRLDFKSARISAAKLSQSLSALSNTDGGELFVGIEDDRRWIGFDNLEAANPIASVICDVFPVEDYVSCVFLYNANEQGFVLKIEIFRTPDVKSATSGSPYKRFGAQNGLVAQIG